MKKKFATLLLSLVASFSLGLATPNKAHAAVADWQRGALVQSRYSEDFASSSYKQSIDKLAATGANYVTLVVSVYQDNPYSTTVQAGNNTPSDQALAAGIQYAKSRGLNVAVSLHDNNYDGQWRAFINPGDRGAWFASYGAMLNKLAVIAQVNGANEMVLGTELVNMTDANRNPTNTANWVAMIGQVRARFSGSLTYSAQHSGDISDSMTLGFWPQLDKIGLSAYFGLGYDSSVSAIKGQWQKWNDSYVNVLAQRYGKQVIFTEVGYQSKQNALADPGSSYNMGGGVDLTLQANAYQALMEYWNNYAYMGGVFWWDWNSDPNYGGPNNNDYSPQSKPAENIMKQWFGGTAPTPGSGGGPAPTPAPTPSPVPPPAADPANASYTVGFNNPSGIVNSAIAFQASVTANKDVAGALVDLEIYDSNGQRVLQKAYDNQTLSTGPKTYSETWTPTNAGDYKVKIGIFTASWQKVVYWNDAAGTIKVAAANPAPAPTPSPVPVPAPNPKPTPGPTPTPTSNPLSIWWPSNGAAVTGVQPFKATVDGLALSSYNLFWQVDNGALNSMGDSLAEAPHKESLVNLSSWNWNSTNRYTLNFIAKDTTGTLIRNKSVVITIPH